MVFRGSVIALDKCCLCECSFSSAQSVYLYMNDSSHTDKLQLACCNVFYIELPLKMLQKLECSCQKSDLDFPLGIYLANVEVLPLIANNCQAQITLQVFAFQPLIVGTHMLKDTPAPVSAHLYAVVISWYSSSGVCIVRIETSGDQAGGYFWQQHCTCGTLFLGNLI